MHGTIEIRLSRPPVKANFHCLPLEIRERLDLKVETFDKTSLTVATSNTGRQNPLPFIRFYCVDCQTKLLPKLLNNPKYGNLKTVEELVTNWDTVGVPEGLTDLIGCFVCDLDERVHMGPNKNNFFKDPTNHRKSLHPELWFDKVDRMGKKHVERVTEIQKLLCSDKSTAPNLTLQKPAVPCKEKSSSSNSNSSTSAQQAVITGKYNSKTKFRFVDESFQKNLGPKKHCESTLQKIAKGFCLSVVHNGLNKCLSEAAIIEMYDTAYRGIYDQSLVLTEDFKQMLDKTSRNTVMPLQQAVLNKDNIILYERAILDA